MKRRVVPQSLEENIYGVLREQILNGERMPGDSLVEAQLSEEFGTSKTPVREALIRLKRDGFVDASLHRISRVASPSAADVREACEVREWIEVELTARCAEAPSEELLEALRSSIDDAELALRRSQRREYVAAVRRFSDELIQASGNRYAAQALERLRAPLALIANISRSKAGRAGRSIDEHRAIYDAIAARDPAAAAEATRSHLRSIQADSLAALESRRQR